MTTNNSAIDASLNDFLAAQGPAAQGGTSMVPLAQSYNKVVALTLFLPEKDAQGKNDPTAIKQKLRTMLIIYRTVEKCLDPKFDPNDRPMMEVAPPGLNTDGAQVDPATIPDEKTRQAYEAAIAANKKKTVYVNQQFFLRRSLREGIGGQILSYVNRSYRSVAGNEKDLVQLANEVGIGDAFQKEMIDALKNGFPPPSSNQTPKLNVSAPSPPKTTQP